MKPLPELSFPGSRGEREPFPDSSRRAEQYDKVASVIADGLAKRGYPLTETSRETWRSAARLLADADERSEASPQAFRNGADALAFIGLPITPDTERAAEDLLIANQRGLAAQTTNEHLDYRQDEATAMIELLRLSSGELAEDEHLWEAMQGFGRAGIYFDSLLDARQDAQRLPISAGELTKAASGRFFREIRRVDQGLLLSFLSSASEAGMVRYLLNRQRARQIVKRVLVDTLRPS